jgi:hypothetical protein
MHEYKGTNLGYGVVINQTELKQIKDKLLSEWIFEPAEEKWIIEHNNFEDLFEDEIFPIIREDLRAYIESMIPKQTNFHDVIRKKIAYYLWNDKSNNIMINILKFIRFIFTNIF